MDPCFIGIDIGGTNLRFALVGNDGTILHRYRLLSSIDEGREAFCHRLMTGIEELRPVAISSGLHLAGIGAGVPGLVGADGVIFASVNMRPLDGFNLSAFLAETSGLPVLCGNDANLIGLGEFVYGAGRGYSSLVVISIGTGLGSGLILDGRLWTGSGGFAAEFGHVTVHPEGPVCPCGNRGCLEQYVSASSIVRLARERFSSSRLAELGDLPLDAGRLALLARQGETAALAAFEEAGRWLGVALASLANTLNLEAAVIGGGVAASLDLMLPAVSNELRVRCFPQMAERLALLPGSLGDDAGLLGAAALIRTQQMPCLV